MAIDPAEECLHPAGDDLLWQESVFIAWRDCDAGVGGNHRIGIEANRQEGNIWCGVYADTGERYRHNAAGLALPSSLEPRGLALGPQSMIHDGKSLRLRYDTGECSVDLRFADIVESWGHTSDEQKEMSQAFHYDTHCRVTGHARIGEREWDVSGYCWRDHSWGSRNWARILAHRCLVGRFGDDLGYEFFSMMADNGVVSRDGAIIRGTVREPISDFTMTVALAEDAATAREAAVKARLADGSIVELRFELADGVVVETREFVGIEAVGSASVASEGKRGFGYFAMSNNARAGAGFPPLTQFGVSTNGLSVRPERHRKA